MRFELFFFYRSILTVPWVELGGSVSITCAKTGYSATVEFLTKPFYGGKKNRITAEVLQPDRKPFVTISGEWNGSMMAKWSDGVCNQSYCISDLNLVIRHPGEKNNNENSAEDLTLQRSTRSHNRMSHCVALCILTFPSLLTVQRTEEFVNVNAIPIIRKRVRPVAEQTEFESRRLWREVTLGLK